MKYIILAGPDGEVPLLFPRAFTHSWVAGQMAPLTAVSAGFLQAAGGEISCYGSSESLGIPSRPARDAALVRRALEGAGGSGHQ